VYDTEVPEVLQNSNDDQVPEQFMTLLPESSFNCTTAMEQFGVQTNYFEEEFN
ncbi:24012_t:CDS:1, partial [Racocetra persica]